MIQYLGRKQRHKPVANVLHELDDQYRHGYRSVFLADDNFTAYRRRAKELLAAIRDYMYDHGSFWEAQLADQASPAFAALPIAS